MGKQRKGKSAESATEAECNHLEESQRQKKLLVENLEKDEKESKRLKEAFEDVEKATSSASRKTPQQLRRSGSDRQTSAPRSSLTPLPTLKKKEADTGKQESSNLFRTPASVNLRRTPEQLRKASPSIGASSRGNRSLLKPPMSPRLQNKGHSLLKASPATAPKSPFDVLSPTSDSDMD